MTVTAKSQTQARYRKRHPERHTLALKIQAARTVAALRVANRHFEEWDEEILRECRAWKIPRFLPPLPPELDGRKVRER